MTRNVTIRVSRAGLSLCVHVRTLLVLTIVLTGLAFALVLTVAFGDTKFALDDVARAVLGTGGHEVELVVRQFRLPRALEAALVGAMLGLSGALFQRLLQNPLVAPDVIGINQGAAVGAVAVIMLSSSLELMSLAAFAGGIAAAFAGYLLSLRRGLSPYRLVLVGIAINAMLHAALIFLLAAPLNDPEAQQRLATAQDWLFGTVSLARWPDVRLLAVALAALLPVALLLGRALDVMALGEETARSLSVRVDRTRLLVVLVGVLLAAIAVSRAGPIGFVAFIAPHIAWRLARSSSTGALLLSAAVGALLLVVADYLGKRILEPQQLPVGIVSVALGAPYFLLLLYRGGRKESVV